MLVRESRVQRSGLRGVGGGRRKSRGAATDNSGKIFMSKGLEEGEM